MKLFRINKVEEFFGSYPKASLILSQAEKEFEKTDSTLANKSFAVSPQVNFEGVLIHLMFELKNIAFVGEYELYCYDFVEIDMS
jgi:hypothetical protein